MCGRADRSVRAFQDLCSSFPGTAAQLGPSVHLRSFQSLGLTLLFYCRSGVMFNANFLKSHANIWIFLWEDQILVAICWFKSQPWQDSRPALQGSKGTVVRRPMPGPDSFTLYKMLCYICFISCFISSCFSFLFNTMSSSQSCSERLLWMLNKPVISGTPVSEVYFCRKRDL